MVLHSHQQGMLGIGAVMLGSPYVCCVDVDGDALAQALENASQFEGIEECIDFVRMDIRQLAARIAAGYAGLCAILLAVNMIGMLTLRVQSHHPRQPLPDRTMPRADTVIMNPPFGTKSKGADMEFLCVALKATRHTVCFWGVGTNNHQCKQSTIVLQHTKHAQVYSLHKSSTRAHIQRVACSQYGASSAEVLAELRYDLPATYHFHKYAQLVEMYTADKHYTRISIIAQNEEQGY